MSTIVDPFADFAGMLTRTEPTATPLHLQMFTLFGAAGTGKTTIAASNPHHLYIDLEASATEHSINKLDIRTWKQYVDLLTTIHDNPTSPFDGMTWTVDTVTDLWELAVKHHLAERKLPEMPDDFGRTLTAIRKDFKRVMQMHLNLRMQGRMGTLLIAHEEVEEIKTPLSTTSIFRPRVTDRDIKGYVAEKPQMVLRTSREDVHPVTGKPFSETKFLIRTKPLNAGDVVKDRTMRLPAITRATWESLQAAYDKATTTKENSE